MGRPLWFVAGAGVGVYAAARARRAAEALTPEGLSDRLSGLRRGAELFTDELRTEMGVKETELREQLGRRPTSIGEGVPELTTSTTEKKDQP